MKNQALALAAMISLLSAPTSFPQGITGRIQGWILDPSGLPIAGAGISLTETTAGLERSSTTNEAGEFVFAGLRPGKYSIKIAATGFRAAELDSINLPASESLSLGKIRLEVGSQVESVTITAQGASVQTVSSERSGVITGAQVQNLAFRGRNVISFLQLLPGVVGSESDAIDRSYNANVLGNRANTNNVNLDGVSINSIGGNSSSVAAVSMDAVAEVKVLLSSFQAEFGHLSGANIQLILKSGTRDFHGSGSYFKRHEQFNANNFFNNRLGQRKPRYRFNTYNYTVGGPVYIPGKFNRSKDKLFFFWSQEYWPKKTSMAVSQLTVPTPLERSGDFSASLDLNGRVIPVADPLTRQPFPANRVPASLVNRDGQALLNVFPQPNFLDRSVSAGRYNYVFQAEYETPQRLESLKIDLPLNPRHLFSGSLAKHSDRQTGGMTVGTAGANWEQLRRSFVSSGTVVTSRYQRIFSPSLINELTFGYTQRPEWESIPDSELDRNRREKIGFSLGQMYPAANSGKLIPNATFGGVSQPANLNLDGRTPLYQDQWWLTLANNVTKIAAGHTLKGGVFFSRSQRMSQLPTTFNGAFDFARNVNNPLDTGYAYSNAVLGVFNVYAESNNRPAGSFRVNSWQWFVQDSWRIVRRLTLEVGMRFTLLEPMYERDGLISSFDPARFDRARMVQLVRPARVGSARVGVHPVTGAVYPAALIGAIAPGTGDTANGMVVAAENPGAPRGLVSSPGVDFGPRFGFAWDLTGAGRTALRGGFGIFTSVPEMQLLRLLGSQPPLSNTPRVTFGQFSGLTAAPGFLFPQNVLGNDPKGRNASAMHMSLSVQHRLGWGTVVDIGYAGSLGRHIFWQRNEASIPFGANFDPRNADPTSPGTPLPPAFLRERVGYNDINIRDYSGTSHYHSLQVSANRRFARNLEFGASWTWSKAMTYVDSDFSNISTLISPRVWNYGLASFDRTHVLKINYLWSIPGSPWGAPVARAILNGWQLSGISSFVSGQPLGVGFSLVQATDITGSPTDGARIFVLSNPILPKSERTFSRNFGTEVFRVPAIGTFGNAARTLIRGPGINNWDAALFKNFTLREPLRLQFRWELYNVLNHTQFSDLDTTARFDARGSQVNARLGEFTAARPPRVMQLALRLLF